MSARSLAQVLGGYGQRKAKGNPHAPTDPVRSHSHDVNDAKAKPGRRIGDGSPQHQWALRKALVSTLTDLRERQLKEKYKGEFPIQANDAQILNRMLGKYLFGKNGDFFPSYKTIAESTGLSEKTIKRAVAAFEYHGFLCHVRRSRKVEANEGQPGPQRETAPNAYYFDCKARMASDLWRSLRGALISYLKRLGKAATRAAGVIQQAFNSTARPAPRCKDTELRMTLQRLSDGIDRRDRALAATRPDVPRRDDLALARVQT